MFLLYHSLTLATQFLFLDVLYINIGYKIIATFYVHYTNKEGNNNTFLLCLHVTVHVADRCGSGLELGHLASTKTMQSAACVFYTSDAPVIVASALQP